MVSGSKSKQVSESQQQSQSSANSAGWNYGQNQSVTGGQSTQGGSSFGQSGQDVWGAQAPALQALYAQAQGLLGGQQPAGAAEVTGAAQNAWMNQLTPGGNPYFSQSVQGAIDQATQGFTRGVLPELKSSGVAAEQYGSPRQQLATGEAAGLFGQGLARTVGDMYTQQYQGDQNRALGALGMAPGMLGMSYAPLQQAQSMIGGPTVLGQSSQGSSNFGQSSNFGASSGFTAGSNQSEAQSNSSGYSGSTGRSAGFGIMSK